jgi:hypothetical protein
VGVTVNIKVCSRTDQAEYYVPCARVRGLHAPYARTRLLPTGLTPTRCLVTESPKRKRAPRRNGKQRTPPQSEDPQSGPPFHAADRADPGDATQRNFRYQHTYAVMLMIDARAGGHPYVAIWCEHHEDILAERTDGKFDAYQVKTSRPAIGAWTMLDAAMTKSVGRFVDLVSTYGSEINSVIFVSNTEWDRITDGSTNETKRGKCPELFLDHVRRCTAPADVEAPFKRTFETLVASCGCDPTVLLATLHRMRLVLGPSRTEFDAAVAHEHLPQLPECRTATVSELDRFRDELVMRVFFASSLRIDDPLRHTRPLTDVDRLDPTVAAKRLVIADVVVFRAPDRPPLQFPGEPTLSLRWHSQRSVLQQKLERAGLTDQLEFLKDRGRAAEYHLLEDTERRPDKYPKLLKQLEQMVLGECTEANLHARQVGEHFGERMLIDVQDRLRRLAADRPLMVGNQPYEVLLGVAALLTDECRVWWSSRFSIDEDVA